MSNISKGIRATSSFTFAVIGFVASGIVMAFTAVVSLLDLFPGGSHGKSSWGDRLYVLALFMVGLTFCVGFGIYLRGRIRRWKHR